MARRPNRYAVLLTEGAEQDLESIYDYIAEFDCIEHAQHVLDQLLEALKPDKQNAAQGQPPAAGSGDMQPGMPPTDQLPPLAQLKALRALQADMAARTVSRSPGTTSRSPAKGKKGRRTSSSAGRGGR